ncbi:MAG: 2,3-bisphosphoglycerate-independent phosphoglycerate mutase [Planctomycetes bacterium]|nr:2,3-bisphosphoglycerate-independent phosphoglycerate mutase [Planctomycetota bacterium]
MPRNRPVLLTILDGFGERADAEWNAIRKAPATNILNWQREFPSTLLSCSGNEVGLPLGLMGNSEVGHTNMGAGRIVWQEITRIDRSIAEGKFYDIPAFTDAADSARKNSKKLHLFGLVSDGGVHSSDRHVRALLELAKRRGLTADRVSIHAFLDGRDTPPKSGAGYLAALEKSCKEIGAGAITTIIGRYFAMDRDKRWDRVKLAYDALTLRAGARAGDAAGAIADAYARGETDEFVKPIVVGDPARGAIEDGDSVIFFNFRADRAREISSAFLFDNFDGFERAARPKVHFATMTRYREDFPCPVAFAPQSLKGSFPELISSHGITQLRIAETEKYAHVTYFFNGGEEKAFPGEDRVLVPSPKVATYDLKPSMSAEEVTAELLQKIEEDRHGVMILNFANPDMVGHTGIFEAACEAVATVDRCLGKIVAAIRKKGGVVAITADHGNCELMRDLVTGEPHTAHTTNPVPFILIGDDYKGAKMREWGILADVTPTLLDVMKLQKHPLMDGKSLLL